MKEKCSDPKRPRASPVVLGARPAKLGSLAPPGAWVLLGGPALLAARHQPKLQEPESDHRLPASPQE